MLFQPIQLRRDKNRDSLASDMQSIAAASVKAAPTGGRSHRKKSAILAERLEHSRRHDITWSSGRIGRRVVDGDRRNGRQRRTEMKQDFPEPTP
jgi:hypothetical protein